MPWKDSVIFINKYIGNKETSDTTTIDAFFKDKKIDYIKADVEGMEEQLLIGARNTMLNKCKRILICLYHLANAEETVINYLNEYGFDHITNPSYMIYYAYDNMPPFLRRGVCFGYKV